MPKKQRPSEDDPEQSKRFIDAAREAEADETESGADRAFKKVIAPSRQRSEPLRPQTGAREAGKTEKN